MMKIDRGLLPVKAHFFFFFAALGPLLPQMNVFGRQLGISASTMGLVTAVLPLLWAAAKPTFGYLVDYFTSQRKLIFILLIAVMTGSYCCLWFLPMPEEVALTHTHESTHTMTNSVYIDNLNTYTRESILSDYNCHWNCSGNNLKIWFSNTTTIDTLYVETENVTCQYLNMEYVDIQNGRLVCTPKYDCHLFCMESEKANISKREISDAQNRVLNATIDDSESTSDMLISIVSDGYGYLTGGATFWLFVVLMCLGTVAFNVANCISDAICFDVLGPDRGSIYGSQRAWGTVGYGLTALVGGLLVDMHSTGDYKDFTPAFALALVFTCADLFCTRKLKLPSLSSPDDSGKALCDVLRMPRVIIFICFAVIAGTFDSFIIYYMFWFLEDLAKTTGHSGNIKLIEGVVVAAESFIGELLFFFLSGKILKKFGFGWTMSFSLLCYGIRMGLISIITNPWQLVFIEGIMQGPTYALCYSSIVGYAALVAPEGYSATIQGVVAGMDDGVGFALGSLLGGQLYTYLGPRGSFRIMAAIAVTAAVCQGVLTRCNDTKTDETKKSTAIEEGEKFLPTNLNSLINNDIYKDTCVPLKDEGNLPR